MTFIYSILLSIKDLGKSEIKKLSIINGSFWLIVWLIVGFLTWDLMISFTSKLLNLFPFTFIQLSGTQILFTILYLQSIFVTIGILFSIFNEIIEKELEKTHFKYLGITIGAIIVGFWSYIFFSHKNSIEDYLFHILKILPFQTIEEIMSILLAILFFYLLFCVSISISFIYLFIPKLKELAKEEYPDIEIKEFDKKLHLIVIRDLVIYIILAIILYPFMLIPWINILTLLFIWTYMIKDSYYHTVKILFDINLEKKEIYLLSLISTILNFLPIINIFAPAFGILNFFHYGIEKKLDSLSS